MTERRKLQKVQPYTPSWKKQAAELALNYVTIHPCRECGRPVIKPYCCTWCGSTEP